MSPRAVFDCMVFLQAVRNDGGRPLPACVWWAGSERVEHPVHEVRGAWIACPIGSLIMWSRNTV